MVESWWTIGPRLAQGCAGQISRRAPFLPAGARAGPLVFSLKMRVFGSQRAWKAPPCGARLRRGYGTSQSQKHRVKCWQDHVNCFEPLLPCHSHGTGSQAALVISLMRWEAGQTTKVAMTRPTRCQSRFCTTFPLGSTKKEQEVKQK